MYAKPDVSALHGLFRQLCPRCRIGSIFRSSIFRGFPAMNDRCAVCGLKFEREEGYFLGAMIIDYGLGLVIVSIIAAIVWFFTRWSLEKTAIAAFLLFVPAIPLLTRLGRVLWIYFDQSIDPEQR